MAHDARAVANVLIDRSLQDEKPLTPLQIIKLVYFCHGWMLGLYGRPLVSQSVEAWQYGPVIADVYRQLRRWRDNPVKRRLRVSSESFDAQEEDIIRQVYEKYGVLDGIRLSQLTHAPGTPWAHVWFKAGKNSVVPNNMIKEHYAELAAR